MILTGIGDEAGVRLDAQIKAARELGWSHLEMRAVEVPGFARGNFHDIPGQAFDLAVQRLKNREPHPGRDHRLEGLNLTGPIGNE